MKEWFSRRTGWVTRVEESLRGLRTDFNDPTRLRACVRWELRNLARDIESARRRGDTEEATDLSYYAGRLRNELLTADVVGRAG